MLGHLFDWRPLRHSISGFRTDDKVLSSVMFPRFSAVIAAVRSFTYPVPLKFNNILMSKPKSGRFLFRIKIIVLFVIVNCIGSAHVWWALIWGISRNHKFIASISYVDSSGGIAIFDNTPNNSGNYYSKTFVSNFILEFTFNR